MKKIFMLGVLGLLLGASAGMAQVGCVNFDNFCDALELELSGNSVTGTWVSWDCAGSNAPMTGYIDDGLSTVICLDGACPNGSQYSFNINSGDFDLWLGTDPWVQLQDDSPWTLSDGACPTKPADGSPATWQR